MHAYITSIGLVSPQPTLDNDFSHCVKRDEAILSCVEPVYKELINPVQLRRMSRILKMGLGASQLCLNRANGIKPDAIVVGTGLACINDLETFLASMIDEKERSLSPIPFINSSHNTVAAQIARTTKNNGYNNTYCHRGLSFENALIDALMLINEKEAENVLLGGIDEFSPNYYRLYDYHNMWKKNGEKQGAFAAGEGAGFFMLSATPSESCYAKITGIKTWRHTSTEKEVKNMLAEFLANNGISTDDIDVTYLGFNGDDESDKLYQAAASSFAELTCVAHYKHLCGEFMTSNTFSMAAAAVAIHNGAVPPAFVLREGAKKKVERVVIYNHYQGVEHSIILLEK